eukprot:13566146-Alexandrium_andersonii.AAC.1
MCIRDSSPPQHDGGPARAGGSSHGALRFPSHGPGNGTSTWHAACRLGYRHPAEVGPTRAPPPSQLRAA